MPATPTRPAADAVRSLKDIREATLAHLRDPLKIEMRGAGISEVDDLLRAFFATFLPERRAAVCRDSYL